MFVVRHTRTIL